MQKIALVLNNIKNPKIEINVKKENDKAIITIEDNANGIKEDFFRQSICSLLYHEKKKVQELVLYV